MPWKNAGMSGKCICLNPCDDAEIRLYSKGRFLINFLANVNGKSSGPCDVAVSLQMVNARRHSDLFTYKNHLSCADKPITISLNGIMADTIGHSGISSIILQLVSPADLWVEDSSLSVIEI